MSVAAQEAEHLGTGDVYLVLNVGIVIALKHLRLSFQDTDRYFGRPHPQRLGMKLPFWVGIVVGYRCYTHAHFPQE